VKARVYVVLGGRVRMEAGDLYRRLDLHGPLFEASQLRLVFGKAM
jgi:hypothetical protein